MQIALGRRTIWSRFSAGLTLFFFLAGSPASYSAPAQNLAPESGNRPATLSEIQIPGDSGTLQEIFEQRSGSRVLILQDAHAQPEAQHSIEKILGHLAKSYGIQNVAVEGAQGPMDITLLRAAPDKNSVQKILNEFRKKGELSGSVNAAVSGEIPLSIFGIEEPSIFSQEIENFLNALNKNPGILEKITALEKELASEKEKTYSAEMKKADAAVKGLEENTVSFPKALETLSRLKSPDKFPSLKIIVQEIEHEKNGAAFQEKMEKWISAVSAAVRGKELEKEWTTVKQSYKTQQSDAAALLIWCQKQAEDGKIRIKFPKEFQKRIDSRRELENLQGVRFTEEWDNYLKETFLSLASGPSQKVYEKAVRIENLKKLALFQLTPAMWRVTRANHVPEASGLRLDAHRKFYELAEQRDKIFYQKLKDLMKKNPGKDWVFLAGGFHAQGLKELLKADKVSCAVVLPKISKLEKEERYFQIMQGQVSWKKDFRREKGNVDLYGSFLSAVTQELLKNSTGSPLPVLKQWRDQTLRLLASEGRSGDAQVYLRFLDEAIRSELRKSENEGLRKSWKEKIEKFLKHWNALPKSESSNPSSIARLFTQTAAAPYTDKPVFPEWSVPAPVADRWEGKLLDAEPTRAEIRTAGEEGGGEVVIPPAPLEGWKQELEDFKNNGAGENSKAYWTAASKEFKHQLLRDLAKKVTAIRRKDEQIKINREEKVDEGIERPLAFLIGPHQLRWEDFNVEVYPGRNLATFLSAYRSDWEASGKNQEIELIDYILDELEMGPPDVPKERIRNWVKDQKPQQAPAVSAPAAPAAPGTEEKPAEPVPQHEAVPAPEITETVPAEKEIAPEDYPKNDPKKVEKMVELLDFLAGNEHLQTPGHDWDPEARKFEPAERPRNLQELMAADYFRSKWIDAQGGSRDYSVFGIFHELGFLTGPLALDRRTFFFDLVAVASVVRAMRDYPEAFGMNAAEFAAATWSKRSELAQEFLKQFEKEDKMPPPLTKDLQKLRETEIITPYDLSTRAYQHLFLNHIQQVYYWQNLLTAAWEEQRKREIGIAEEIFKEGDTPALRVEYKYQRNKRIVTAIWVYRAEADGKIIFEDRLKTAGNLEYQEGQTLEHWRAQAGLIVERIFFDQEDRKAARMTVGGGNQIETFEQFETEEGEVRASLRHELLDKKIVFDENRSLEEWLLHLGSIETDPEPEEKEEADEETVAVPLPDQSFLFLTVEKTAETKKVEGKLKSVAQNYQLADQSGFYDDHYETMLDGVVAEGIQAPQLAEMDEGVPFKDPAGAAKGTVAKIWVNKRWVKHEQSSNLMPYLYPHKRSFIDNEERPVGDLLVDQETGHVKTIVETAYQGKRNPKPLISEEWEVLDEVNVRDDMFTTFESWTANVQKRLKKKTFYDKNGKPSLILEYQDSKIASIVQYEGKGENRKKITYAAKVVEVLAQRDTAAWDLKAWLATLADYRPFFDAEAKRSAIEQETIPVSPELAAEKELIDFAVDFYKQHRLGYTISVEPGKAVRLQEFMEKRFYPVMKALMGETELKAEEVSSRLTFTLALAAQPAIADLAGLTDKEKELVDQARLIFAHKVQVKQNGDRAALEQIPAKSVTVQDIDITMRVMAGLPVKKEILSDNSLALKMRHLALVEIKVKAADEPRKRYVANVRGNRNDYLRGENKGNLLAAVRNNKTAGWQSALWLVDYLNEEYGPSWNVLDDETLSMMYAAYRQKGYLTEREAETTETLGLERKILPGITDTQHQKALRAGYDIHNRKDWNPELSNHSAAELAQQPQHQSHYDLITSLFHLHTLDQDVLIERIKDMLQLLQEQGVLAITLPATRGFSDEALAQLRAFGVEVEKEGVAFNQLKDEYRGQLLDQNGERGRDAVDAENAIRQRQFYVLVLKKTATVERAVMDTLPADQIEITYFPLDLEGVDGAVLTEDDRLRMKSGKGRDELLQDIEAADLEPSDVMIIKGTKEKQKVVRQRSYGAGESYRDNYRHHVEKLRLLHRYRKLFFENQKNYKERQPVWGILDSFFQDADMKKDGSKKADDPMQYWTEERGVWNPNPKDWEVRFVKHAEGQKGYAVYYDTKRGKVTGVSALDFDSNGKVTYAEPRKMIETFTGGIDSRGNFDYWQANEGKIFTKEIHTQWQKDFYTQIHTAFEKLLDIYPLFKELYEQIGVREIFKFELWFQDDIARSLFEEFIQPEYEELAGPIYQHRDFILELLRIWKNQERSITREEANQLQNLRGMVRYMKNTFQLFGLIFARGRSGGPRLDSLNSVMKEGQRHKYFLEGIASFMSAMMAAQYEQQRLEQAGGKLSTLDVAAGTGAKAVARYRQHKPPTKNMPPPDGVNYQYFELDKEKKYLDQPRPPGYQRTPDGPVRQTEGLAQELTKHYTDDSFDLITALYIVDFLPPAAAKEFFVQANQVLRENGEIYITLPQSWRPSESFLNTLQLLGYEVIAPQLKIQRMTQAWREKIKASYPEEQYGVGYGAEIAAQATRMREKPFRILRLKRVQKLNLSDAQVKQMIEELEPELLEMEKTETGQRGALTGTNPIVYDPEKMRRWMEILKWVLKKWDADDVQFDDPDGDPPVTRAEALKIFPEIETENALEHLYRFRTLFPRNRGRNDHGLIEDYHAYWKSSTELFSQRDIERLAKFYREGTPDNGGFKKFSQDEAVASFDNGAQFYERFMLNRSANSAIYKRNQKLAQETREQRNIFGKFRMAHSHGYLGLTPDDFEGKSAPLSRAEDWNRLKNSNKGDAVWTVRDLGRLARFAEVYKDGNDDVLKTLFEPPAEFLPPAPPAPPAPPSGPGTPPEGPAQPAAPQPASEQITPEQEGPAPLSTEKDLKSPEMQRDLYAAVGRAIEAVRDAKKLPASAIPHWADVFESIKTSHDLDIYLELSNLKLEDGSPLYNRLFFLYDQYIYHEYVEMNYRTLGQSVLWFLDPEKNMNPIQRWSFDGGFNLDQGQGRFIAYDAIRWDSSKISELDVFTAAGYDAPYAEHPEETRLNSFAALIKHRAALKANPESRAIFSDSSKLRVFPAYPQNFDLSALDELGLGRIEIGNLKEEAEKLPETNPLEIRRKKLYLRLLDYLFQPVPDQEVIPRIKNLRLMVSLLNFDRVVSDILVRTQRTPGTPPAQIKLVEGYQRAADVQLSRWYGLAEQLLEPKADTGRIEREMDLMSKDFERAISVDLYIRIPDLHGRIKNKFWNLSKGHLTGQRALEVNDRRPFNLTEPELSGDLYPSASSNEQEKANTAFAIWKAKQRAQTDLWTPRREIYEQMKAEKSGTAAAEPAVPAVSSVPEVPVTPLTEEELQSEAVQRDLYAVVSRAVNRIFERDTRNSHRDFIHKIKFEGLIEFIRKEKLLAFNPRLELMELTPESPLYRAIYRQYLWEDHTQQVQKTLRSLGQSVSYYSEPHSMAEHKGWVFDISMLVRDESGENKRQLYETFKRDGADVQEIRFFLTPDRSPAADHSGEKLLNQVSAILKNHRELKQKVLQTENLKIEKPKITIIFPGPELPNIDPKGFPGLEDADVSFVLIQDLINSVSGYESRKKAWNDILPLLQETPRAEDLEKINLQLHHLSAGLAYDRAWDMTRLYINNPDFPAEWTAKHEEAFEDAMRRNLDTQSFNEHDGETATAFLGGMMDGLTPHAKEYAGRFMKIFLPAEPPETMARADIPMQDILQLPSENLYSNPLTQQQKEENQAYSLWREKNLNNLRFEIRAVGSAPQNAPTPSEDDLKKALKIFESNWKTIIRNFKTSPEISDDSRKNLLPASLKFGADFKNLKDASKITPEQYQDALQFLAGSNGMSPADFEAQINAHFRRKAEAAKPKPAPPAAKPAPASAPASPVNPAIEKIKADLKKKEWQWEIPGDEKGLKAKEEEIILRESARLVMRASGAELAAAGKRMKDYVLGVPERRIVRLLRLEGLMDQLLQDFSRAEGYKIKNVVGDLQRAIPELSQSDFVKFRVQRLHLLKAAMESPVLTERERYNHITGFWAHYDSLNFHLQDLLKEVEAIGDPVLQGLVPKPTPPQSDLRKTANKFVAAKKLYGEIDGLNMKLLMKGQSKQAKEARKAFMGALLWEAGHPGKKNTPEFINYLETSFAEILDQVNTPEEYLDLAMAFQDEVFQRGVEALAIEAFLKKFEKLIETSQQRKDFLRAGKQNPAALKQFQEFIAMLWRSPRLQAVFWNSTAIENFFKITSADKDPLLSMWAFRTLGILYFEAEKAGDAARLQKTAQYSERILREAIIASEAAVWFVLVAMPETNRPALLPAMYDRIRQNLQNAVEDGDFGNGYFPALERRIRGMASAQKLDPDNVSKDLNAVLKNIINSDAYRTLLERERQKLNSEEMQKAFYEMTGWMIEDYQKLITRQKKENGPLAAQPFEPEKFEDLLPFFETSRIFETYPDLAGYDLAKGGPLYQALQLAFLRRQFVKNLAGTYRAVGIAALGKIYQSQNRKFKIHVPLKLPNPLDGGEHEFIADFVEYDANDKIKKIHFLPYGKDEDFNPHPDLTRRERDIAYVLQNRRIRNVLKTQFAPDAEFVVVYPEAGGHDLDLKDLPDSFKTKTSFTDLKTLFQQMTGSVPPDVTSNLDYIARYHRDQKTMTAEELEKNNFPLHYGIPVHYYLHQLRIAAPTMNPAKGPEFQILNQQISAQMQALMVANRDGNLQAQKDFSQAIVRGIRNFLGWDKAIPKVYPREVDPEAFPGDDMLQATEEIYAGIYDRAIDFTSNDSVKVGSAQAALSQDRVIAELVSNFEIGVWVANQYTGYRVWELSDLERQAIESSRLNLYEESPELFKAGIGSSGKFLRSFFHRSLWDAVVTNRDLYLKNPGMSLAAIRGLVKEGIKNSTMRQNGASVSLFLRVLAARQALRDSNLSFQEKLDIYDVNNHGNYERNYMTAPPNLPPLQDPLLKDLNEEGRAIARETQTFTKDPELKIKAHAETSVEDWRIFLQRAVERGGSRKVLFWAMGGTLIGFAQSGQFGLHSEQDAKTIQNLGKAIFPYYSDPEDWKDVYAQLMELLRSYDGATSQVQKVIAELAYIVFAHLYETIFKTPEGRKEFILTHAKNLFHLAGWQILRNEFDFLKLSVFEAEGQRGIDRVPYLKAYEEALLSRDALLVSRAVRSLKAIEEVIADADPSRQQLADFIGFIFEKYFEQYGFDIENYYQIYDTVADQQPLWREAIVKKAGEFFREKLKQGIIPDHKKFERMVRVELMINSGLDKTLENIQTETDKLLRNEIRTKSVFEQMIDEHRRAQYDLESDSVQKDLYAVVQQNIRTYEKEKYTFPTFDELITYLQADPERIDFYGALRGLDLQKAKRIDGNNAKESNVRKIRAKDTNEKPLKEGEVVVYLTHDQEIYEQLKLQYARVQWVRNLEDAYKTFTKWQRISEDYKDKTLLFDLLLPLNHPAGYGDTQNLIADVVNLGTPAIDLAKERPPVARLVWYSLGARPFPFEGQSGVREFEEVQAHLTNNARLRDLKPHGMNFDGTEFTVTFLNPDTWTAGSKNDFTANLPSEMKTNTIFGIATTDGKDPLKPVLDYLRVLSQKKDPDYFKDITGLEKEADRLKTLERFFRYLQLQMYLSRYMEPAKDPVTWRKYGELHATIAKTLFADILSQNTEAYKKAKEKLNQMEKLYSATLAQRTAPGSDSHIKFTYPYGYFLDTKKTYQDARTQRVAVVTPLEAQRALTQIAVRNFSPTRPAALAADAGTQWLAYGEWMNQHQARGPYSLWEISREEKEEIDRRMKEVFLTRSHREAFAAARRFEQFLSLRNTANRKLYSVAYLPANFHAVYPENPEIAAAVYPKVFTASYPEPQGLQQSHFLENLQRVREAAYAHNVLRPEDMPFYYLGIEWEQEVFKAYGTSSRAEFYKSVNANPKLRTQISSDGSFSIQAGSQEVIFNSAGKVISPNLTPLREFDFLQKFPNAVDRLQGILIYWDSPEVKSLFAEFDAKLAEPEERKKVIKWLSEQKLTALNITFLVFNKIGSDVFKFYPNWRKTLEEGVASSEVAEAAASFYIVGPLLEDTMTPQNRAAYFADFGFKFFEKRDFKPEASANAIFDQLLVAIPREKWGEIMEQIMRKRLEAGLEADAVTTRRWVEAALIRKSVPAAEISQIVALDKTGKSRFERAAEEESAKLPRPEIRTKQEPAAPVLTQQELRAEIRIAPAFNSPVLTSTEAAKLAASYLIQDKLPDPAFVRLFTRTAGESRREIEANLLEIAASMNDPEAAAAFYARTLPDWRDSEMREIQTGLNQNLEKDGVVFYPQKNADVVMAVENLQDRDSLLSVLQSEAGLNLVTVWSGGDKNKAEIFENAINQMLGVTGAQKRFRLLVSEPAQLNRSLNQAAQILTQLRGKGTASTVRDRIIYVLPKNLSASYEPASGKVLLHELNENDGQRFGKEFLLLKTAAEISQDALTALFQKFLQGAGSRFFFNDGAIPPGMLTHFLEAEHQIEILTARSA